MMNWFIGLGLIFLIGIGWMLLTKPFVKLDNSIEPLLDDSKYENQDNKPIDVVKTVRKYWVAFPIVLIVSIIVWMYLSSLKQDPNYPYE